MLVLPNLEESDIILLKFLMVTLYFHYTLRQSVMEHLMVSGEACSQLMKLSTTHEGILLEGVYDEEFYQEVLHVYGCVETVRGI